MVAEGQAPDAAQLYGALGMLLESMHTRLMPYDQERYDHHLADLRAQLDPAVFAAAWAEGRALTMEQAVAFALTG